MYALRIPYSTAALALCPTRRYDESDNFKFNT